MRKRFLSILTVLALALSLVPTSAWASGGETAESGGVLIGARWNEDKSLTPITDSEVTYEITENESGGYTLTFSGSGAIPDYYTETQGYTADGVEIYKTENTWADEDGIAHEDGPVNISCDYRYCTSDRAYYRSTQWDVFNTDYEGAITKVVFEKGITYIGCYTLFNMTGVTSIEIEDPACRVAANAIYFNNSSGTVVAPNCTISMASTVNWNASSVGHYESETVEPVKGDITYQYPDAVAFAEQYDELLSADASSLTVEQKEAIETAYAAYANGNDTFRTAVEAAAAGLGDRLTALYEAVTGIDPDHVTVTGPVLAGSSIQYELESFDGGETYTLTFSETKPENGGVMPDFTTDTSSPACYTITPWYDREYGYRLKITRVVYDETINETGSLTATHLFECKDYVFENPNVEIVSNTVNFYGSSEGTGYVLHYSAYAGVSSSAVSYSTEAQEGVKPEDVSVSYLEAEEFEEKYGAMLAGDSVTALQATEMKDAFERLPAVCKEQLGVDQVEGTGKSYEARLNEILEGLDLGPADDSTIVAEGPIPSGEGENETVYYRITTSDGVRYVVRFYETDSYGDGVIPNYHVRGNNSGSWEAYEDRPWSDTKFNIVKMIFDESITEVGQHVAANMSRCEEYEFLNPNVKTHQNAIYVNGQSSIREEGVTIHAWGTADINWFYNEGNFNKEPNNVDFDQEYVDSRIHFSYYEAEQFKANEDYTELWTLDVGNAGNYPTLIQQAYREYNSFADAVKQQLDTDTIPNTATTYAEKLTALMGALDLGGDVSDGVDYTLSLNEDNATYTLTLSGSGTVSVTATAPWSAHANSITDVVLAEGITSVAAGAFDDLTALKSVDVAESVKTIDNGAFPTTSFEMYGWLNHASGQYAEGKDNVQLRLKDLRILTIGNSHTSDYLAYWNQILADQGTQVGTNITVERLLRGGRGLYIEQADPASSHYKVAHDPDFFDPKGLEYEDYEAKFEAGNTWDLIIVQDYHESTKVDSDYGGAAYVDEMQKVIQWLQEEAEGAEIAWFADWADKAVNGTSNLDTSYEQSVAAMNEVKALQGNKPDFIIPASTVLQNARTSYLGTTNNATDALENYEGVFTDFAKGQLQDYSLLERDGTHMSLETGRYLMGSFVLYSLFKNYESELITTEGFDFLKNLTTPPTYEDRGCVWQGEFTPEIWEIIKESCQNAWEKPYAVTECDDAYQTDPFQEKYAQVESILNSLNSRVTLPTSQDALNAVFKSADVVAALSKIEGLGITEDDIVVTYTAPSDSTDGSYTVAVNCHYGYSYPTGSVINTTIPAENVSADELAKLREKATAKLESYMSIYSYSETDGHRAAVEEAKEDGKTAITNADTKSEIEAALQNAEAAIDAIPTIFAEKHPINNASCVACGQIWTGGWVYGAEYINKNSFVMDVGTNQGEEQDSEFTGVWWLVRQDGSGGYVIEFYPDPAIKTDEKAYTFETPVFNASHWIDPETQQIHSVNPLQYNQTPWFKGYRNTLTQAIVHSGVTINQHTLACYPNITEYVIEDGANLGTNAIYFNPLQNDTVIRFEGSSTVEKDAVSGYRVANSYEYYIDVYGDMGKVTISSRDDMDREPLQGNLYYAFGKYDDTVKAWIASARVYETIAVGLAGEGEDISTGAGFAPHYTDGVDDGTTMLRVFNNTKDHSHTEDSGNRILLTATAGEYPCQTGLSEGYVCKVCDAVIVPQQVIMGTEEHTWVSKVTKQPTATDRGEITFTCQGCGVTKIEYINRLQPDSDAVVSVNGVNYNSIQYAIDQADPGDVVVLLKDHEQDIHLDAEDDVLLDLNGHTLTGDIAVGGQLTIQTSGDGGVVTGTISVGNDGTVQTLSGTYSQNVTSFCPDGYGVILNGDNTYTVHQHIWDAGTVTKPATETADGVRTYKCTVEGCTAQKTERIPATGTEEPDDDDRPSSGGGSSDPSYSPIFDVSDGGEIKVNPRTPEEDDEVTITVTPDRGYELDELIVTDRNGREIDVTAERDGTYTFIQPRGRVTIEATFVRTGETAGLPFVDVPASAYYYDAVAWAVENGVTGGTTATTFSPNNACTRAQMVTFLWRAAGEPEPETTVNPFTDVSASAYYYEAVLWAVERGITNGTSATTFSPDATVTRGQTVTFLWRNAGSPAASGSGFADVAADAYYATAVAWAAREGITSGTSATAFSPSNACTRAQIVTFLYRAQ